VVVVTNKKLAQGIEGGQKGVRYKKTKRRRRTSRSARRNVRVKEEPRKKSGIKTGGGEHKNGGHAWGEGGKKQTRTLA